MNLSEPILKLKLEFSLNQIITQGSLGTPLVFW